MAGSEREFDALHGEVRDRLKDADQLYTSGRRRLVELLAETARPVTIPELVSLHPDLAMSSAYRNLAVLEEVGVASRIVGGGEHARFELAEEIVGDHHHHLICQTCGQVDDFTVPATVERTIERALAKVVSGREFMATSHRLDLVGTCAACAGA